MKEFTEIKIKRRDEKTFMVGLIKDMIELFINFNKCGNLIDNEKKYSYWLDLSCPIFFIY